MEKHGLALSPSSRWEFLMAELKDTVRVIKEDIEDVITEVEDSEDLDWDQQADLIRELDEIQRGLETVLQLL